MSSWKDNIHSTPIITASATVFVILNIANSQLQYVWKLSCHLSCARQAWLSRSGRFGIEFSNL